MTRRSEFLKSHPDFRPGMLAFSDDGQELGEIQKLDEENLTIEKGRFFSMSRRLPYEAVSDIRGNHVIINRSRADLEEGRTPDYTGLRESGESGRTDVDETQTSVPIFQKDLEQLEKTEQDVGTRTPAMEGPPDVERLATERAPTEQRAGPMPGGETFRDVEVRKKPADKQRIRVRKEDVKVERDRPQEKK